MARLRDSKDRAIPVLRNWANARRHREVNDLTIRQINSLPEDQAVSALYELRKAHAFVRGTNGSQLELQTIVQTSHAKQHIDARTLIDSGCQGSCVDIKFARKHNLPLIPLARPIPVFNADGQPNADGPISHMVSLELHVGKHVEHKEFGVTELGNGEIFLGHEWLKQHNPSVDWRTGIIEFN